MRRLSCLLSLASFFIAPLASAQDLELYKPAGRQGYFLGGGLRSGALYTDSEDLGSLGFMQGGGFVFRFGQMSTDWIGFGASVISGGGADDVWTTGYGGLLMDVQLIPVAEFPDLAVRASIGIAGLALIRTEEDQEREDDPDGTFGALYALGISYDWFPWWEKGDTSGGLSFTVYVEAQLLPGSNMVTGGLFMGIEVAYWFGLGDNKLDLTPEEAYGDEEE